jgi:diguanylate cyclase (GGDEF)-like protein
MSFRARLRLFFVLIVIVPMLSVALLLFRLISDNETGKTDSDIHARQHTAIQLFAQARRESERAVEGVGNDSVLAGALRDGNIVRARRRALQIEGSQDVLRITLSRGSHVLVDVGDRTAVAPGQRNLHGTSGRRFGLLEASTTSAAQYANDVRRVSGAQVLILRGGRVLASTLPVAPSSIPPPQEPRNVDVDGKPYRAVTYRTGAKTDFLGQQTDLVVLSPTSNRDTRVGRSRLLAGGILLGFLMLALTFALAVSRSLQAQIGAFLQAARRLGSGDFSTDVPTPGRDEFAELGEEFNKMSRQLAERLEQLREQRGRLESSLRRIGESFASNLDRDALLEIVVRTAVDAVEAEGGRVALIPGEHEPLEEHARAGNLSTVADAIHAAEEEVLHTGRAADVRINDLHALAHPLHGANGTAAVRGLVTVARRAREFDEAERELFGYLAAQAAVSMENVGLHETVQRQAVTDELTGLYNHRRFQEAMDAEAERAKRFGQDMGLVMLDIDNFKQVNDTYGHQQGDVVLAEVARIVRESSREIDAPARYGGEELAVVLPGTDIEGAYNLAERMRHGIEELAFPLADGSGELRVTASLGVASMPRSATDPRELLARADAALYEAKRSGKNKVVRAG